MRDLPTVERIDAQSRVAERPLRVCFVALHFAPYIGGAETRAEKQARQLQALGHSVTILTTRKWKQWPSREIRDGLPIVRVGGLYQRGDLLRIGRLGIWPVNIGVLGKLWRWRRQFDVIHAVQMSSLAAMAVLAGKLTRKPVIISIPTTAPSTEQRMRLERECTLMADTLEDISFLALDPENWMVQADLTHISALGGDMLFRLVRRSHAIYQSLSTQLSAELVSVGFPAGQIVQISGSVDTDRFRPDPNRRPDPGRPERTIVCVARHDYAKGVDVLLHAWGRMLRAPADWRAHLGPRLQLVGDGEIRVQLERIAAALGIEDSVDFLGERTDVIDLLQQAWGFVLPSRWEGMPNALLEAMACGLPCIATRVSGSEDIISNGVDGLLVEPERPAELADALRRIIQDTDLAHRLGHEGRRKVVQKYQLAQVVEEWVALYRRLLADDTGTPHGAIRE